MHYCLVHCDAVLHLPAELDELLCNVFATMIAHKFVSVLLVIVIDFVNLKWFVNTPVY